METDDERRATDAGLTGDKIKAGDPAAAPLHADAEAAGTPTPAGAARATVLHLMSIALSTPRPDTFGAWRQPGAERQRRLGWLLLSWLVILSALGVVAGLVGLP